MFDQRIAALGQPLGVSVLVLTAILAAFGIFAARRGDLSQRAKPRCGGPSGLLSPRAPQI